jgi:hypothetical protein
MKAAALPECIAFEWPGVEHFHDDVFKREVRTLPQAIKCIDQLRQRMAEYSMALDDLGKAYRSMRFLLLELNVEGLEPLPKRKKTATGRRK